MPLNWNGDKTPSSADKKPDLPGFKEIGGVGQLIYHPFRFKSYNLSFEGRDHCAYPLCRPGYEPYFPDEDILTGKGLLVSLCNLAMEINSYDTKESVDKLIVEWCMKNMHPYGIDFIYGELTEEHFDIATIDAYFVEKDGAFEIDIFLEDLSKLYNAVTLYEVFEVACAANDEAVYNLSKEEHYFEELSYFEEYEQAKISNPDELTEMPYSDYETLGKKIMECIPDFTMRLRLDPLTNKLGFSTDVRSVFDIAWFTLARMLSEDTLLEDKRRCYNKAEGVIIRCRHCGKFLIRRSNRQEYCDNDTCQRVRSARKQKAYRDRKAFEKGRSKEETKNYISSRHTRTI